jgi:hypothetical protein
MIDETNVAIGELEERIRRENDRRYSFYRMLHATDRVLWRLEELNRDGVKTMPPGLREAVCEGLAELPRDVMTAYRDSDSTQTVLDSIFDIQERLFRWKDPSSNGDDEEERLAG